MVTQIFLHLSTSHQPNLINNMKFVSFPSFEGTACETLITLTQILIAFLFIGVVSATRYGTRAYGAPILASSYASAPSYAPLRAAYAPRASYAAPAVYAPRASYAPRVSYGPVHVYEPIRYAAPIRSAGYARAPAYGAPLY